MKIKCAPTATGTMYGHAEPVNRYRTASIIVTESPTGIKRLVGCIYRIRALLPDVKYVTIAIHLTQGVFCIQKEFPKMGTDIKLSLKNNLRAIEGSVHVSFNVNDLSATELDALIDKLLTNDYFKATPPFEVALENNRISSTYVLPDTSSNLEAVIKRKKKR